MATVDEIRARVWAALEDKGLTPITAMTRTPMKDTSLSREFLRDFLVGDPPKKNTIAAGGQLLADVLGLQLEDIVQDAPAKPSASIRKGARPRLYITEHMEARGLDDEQLAGRIDGIDADTFERWRREQWKLQDWQVQAVLHALNMKDVAELAAVPRLAKGHEKPEKRPSRAAPRRRA